MNEMKGSGCKDCPVIPCETMNYRGSTCSAQRAKFGLGDPLTNGEYIRSMSDQNLAMFFASYDVEHNRLRLESAGIVQTAELMAAMNEKLYRSWLEWLQKPAKEET